jgi:site-specific recombinase XerD
VSGSLELVEGGHPRGIVERVRPEFRVKVYVADRSDPVLAGPMCAIDGCFGLNVPNGPRSVCSNHARVAKRAGITTDELIAQPVGEQTRYAGDLSFDFGAMDGRVLAEMQFALQCRRDERGARLTTQTFKTAVAIVMSAGVRTLLDRTGSEWFAAAPNRATGTWLKYCHRVNEVAARPPDPRDQEFWLASDFPAVRSPNGEVLRFDTISQAWLRDPIKRWSMWRIQTGKAWKTVHMNLEAMKWFSRYLAERPKQVTSMGQVTRQVILDFLPYLDRAGVADQSRLDHTSGLRLFLDEYRVRDDWGPALPPSGVLRHNDVRGGKKRVPRPVPEPVMRQIEAEENLRRLPVFMLALTLIGIRAGLRLASAVALPFDCLLEDSHGSKNLIYVNTKEDRERVMPLIHDDVVHAIEAQQALAREWFPMGTPHLFPQMRANPGGWRSLSKASVRTALKRWIADCDIRDPATGELAKVTYHQFRHTFATRLLDNGASITLVQQLLDHESPSTTAGYAVLSDSVRRAEFQRVSKVNNRGEIITGSDHALAADAEWFKEGLNRMHVSLPNGYCGLPLQQPCEVRNACLDCDDYFITTPAFLPVHEEQLSETRRLIAVGEANGQLRMVEKNQHLEGQLVGIISALKKDGEADGAE